MKWLPRQCLSTCISDALAQLAERQHRLASQYPYLIDISDVAASRDTR